MKHKSIEPVLKGMAGFIVASTSLTVAFATAHFGMLHLYTRLGLNPDPIIKQVINNDMAQELKQMEAMRQEFISNVSHEIQSPLTSIRGFAQALKNEAISPQERAHYLTIIETESMRLSKLSDNLLALAALEAENMSVNPQPYRLDKQIRRIS